MFAILLKSAEKQKDMQFNARTLCVVDNSLNIFWNQFLLCDCVQKRVLHRYIKMLCNCDKINGKGSKARCLFNTTTTTTTLPANMLQKAWIKGRTVVFFITQLKEIRSPSLSEYNINAMTTATPVKPKKSDSFKKISRSLQCTPQRETYRDIRRIRER